MSRRYLAIVAAAALSLTACNPRANDDQSAVTLTASFEGSDAGSVVGIESDVVTDAGTTADDFFELTITSIVKPNNVTPSDLYRVSLQGVEISYSRPDGRNVPGVDVPFPLRYALGGTVPVGGTFTVNLLVVSQEMKVQVPLRNLWFGEGQRIFATVTATVFGVDQVGNEVQATASAVVVFGDI